METVFRRVGGGVTRLRGCFCNCAGAWCCDDGGAGSVYGPEELKKHSDEAEVCSPS